MNPLRVALVWDWQPSLEQTVQLNDGLQAALRVLEERGHYVDYFTDTKTIIGKWKPMGMLTRQRKFDVILHWADFTRPHAQKHRDFGIPMAICFAGGEAVNYNTPYFDHIFVESQVYKDKLNEKGYDNVSIAFGTNTELFKPIEQKKVFDTLFPATFAKWKRHDLYSQAVEGLSSCAVGYIYTDHETECWEDCIKRGTVVLPHIGAEALHRLYAASRTVVVTSQSDGGSQRTVLEAMAMNIPLIVTDSDKFDYITDEVCIAEPDAWKLREVIDDVLASNKPVNTRDHVLANWSEYKYADMLEAGFKDMLQ